jgi:hypothetical protein
LHLVSAERSPAAPVSIQRGALAGQPGLLSRMHKVWLGIILVGVITFSVALAAA